MCDNRVIKLPEDLGRQLQSLPKLLDGMYSHILNCIDKIQGKGYELATAVIRWLLCTEDLTSKTTMAFLEAAGLVRSEIGFIETILDVCCNLVVYDTASASFNFIHFSAREFLDTRKDFSRSISESFVLRVLFSPGFGPSISVVRPLGRYRLCHWLSHYGGSGDYRMNMFDYCVKSFMFDGPRTSKRYMKWAKFIRGHYLNGEESTKAANDISDTIDVINMPQGDITNPIDLASCNGWLEILRYYMKHETTDTFSKIAPRIFASAIKHDQACVIEWLFECGVRPLDDNIKQMFYQRREETIKTLIGYKMLRPDTEIDGQPLLILAVQVKSSSIVEVLLKAGAKVDCLDRQRRTPLYHAIWNNTESLIGLLLSWEANLDIPDGEGVTPLKLAIQRKIQVASIMTLETNNKVESSSRNDACPEISEKESHNIARTSSNTHPLLWKSPIHDSSEYSS